MRFTFAGADYEGREGETLAAGARAKRRRSVASAALYLDRPRGVYSAGEEEPNALVQVGAQPMQRATLSSWRTASSPSRSRARAGSSRRVRGALRRVACSLRPARRRRRPLRGRGGHGGPSGRSILVRLRARIASSPPRAICASSPGRPPSASTTATTPLAVERGRRLWHIRAKRSCSRRARSSARSSSPTTTGRGSCWPGARRTSLGGPGSPCSRTTRPRSASPPPRSSMHARDGASSILRRQPPRGRPSTTARGRVRRARGLGRLEPGVHLWTSAEGGCVRRAHRRFRPRRRDSRRRGGREAPATAVRRIRSGSYRGTRPPLRRPRARLHGRRHPPRGRRRAALDRARQALHHDRHRLRAGQDRGVNAIGVAAQLLGVSPASSARRPSGRRTSPVSFALLAGRNRGDALRPRPRDADPLLARRARRRLRECRPVEAAAVLPAGRRVDGGGRAARVRGGARGRRAMDASTLGKIDVQGPDAVELLNRLYTNAHDTLAVGRCRYGVMCKPDGMVFDDGVVMRVARSASSAPRPPATLRRCSPGWRSGSRPSGPSSASG